MLGPEFAFPGLAYAVAMSPDGKTAAVAEFGSPNPEDSASWRSTVRLWEGRTGRAVTDPIRHPAAVTLEGVPGLIQAIGFSPDGKTLLTGSTDRTARRWDVVSGKEIGVPLAHPAAVTAVGYSPNGQVIAVMSAQAVRLWAVSAGKAMGGGLDHKAGVLGFAFSADSKTILTAGFDQIARFWDVATGKEYARIETVEGPLRCVTFSPDGRRVMTASQPGVVRLWDVATRRPLGAPLAHSDVKEIMNLAFLADGKSIATATIEGTIRVWDLAGSLRPDVSWKTGEQVTALAFHSDGRSLIAGYGNKARLWDAATGSPLGPPLEHPDTVHSVDLNPDGSIALTACWGMHSQGDNLVIKGEINRWDPRKGAKLVPLAKLPEMVESASFIRGGQSVLVLSTDKIPTGLKLQLFDAASGTPLGSPLVPGGKRADHIALSHDGNIVLTGSHLEKAARVWKFQTGQPQGPPLVHPDWVTAVAFSPDGKTMATGCKDKACRLWDTSTGKPLSQVMEHSLPVFTLAFSPDGRTLACGCADDFFTAGEVRLWDIPSTQSIALPLTHAHGVRAVAFRPDGLALATGDGKLAFSGSGDGNISIWELASPATEPVGRLRLMIQVLTGWEIGDAEDYRPLTPETWRQRKRQLEGIEVGPADSQGRE